jgi:hypothetical protein
MGGQAPGEQQEHDIDNGMQEPEDRFNRELYEDVDEERI